MITTDIRSARAHEGTVEQIRRRNERFYALSETVRPYIIELNVMGNECDSFRHFDLPYGGSFRIYGDSIFKCEHLEKMRATIKRAFPQLEVTETFSMGQNMYGFRINFHDVESDEDVVTYFKSFTTLIKQV